MSEAKISGAILPDLPLIEANSWKSAADTKNREAILLAAPTTTQEHLKKVCQETRGFVYAVGLLGITGARKELAESAKIIAARCKKMSEKPVLVGVGIGTPDQAVEVSKVSDGCIVGSAIVQQLLDGGGPEAVGELVAEFRSALDKLKIPFSKN